MKRSVRVSNSSKFQTKELRSSLYLDKVLIKDKNVAQEQDRLNFLSVAMETESL